MKKLILLTLFIPLLSFGQDLFLDHSFIEPAPYEVGDTITLKFNTIDNNSSVPTLMHFDYQYNVKLLEKIGHVFKLDGNESALRRLSHFDGYTFVPNTDIATDNLSGQYGSGTYTADPDWAVERITVQDSKPIDHNLTIVEVQFRVKDKVNSNYADYSNVTQLNWAYFKDNDSDILYDVNAMTSKIDLGEVGGGQVDAITFKVNTPISNKSDYRYTIETAFNDVTGGFEIVAEGNLDAAGEAIVSGLVDGETYRFFAYIPADYSDPQNIVHPSWLDDVVTISDVYLVFNYMSSTDIDGNGTGTFDYHIQKIFADITWDEPQGEGEVWTTAVNDNDSYVFLSYLAGTLPDYDITTGENFYPITSTKYGSMNYTMLSDKYGMENIQEDPSAFTIDTETTVIEFSAGLHGDVDLSHSHTPETSGYNTSAKSSLSMKVKNTSFEKIPETSDLDISTQLVDGKVVMEINITKEDLAGAQFNLTYDTNILEFSEVIFDSGNAMTNFANERNGKIFIGSLDLNGGEIVKTGTPYKVIFTPKQTITNTIGLVSFGVKEGVKTDGTKVKFNIQ